MNAYIKVLVFRRQGYETCITFKPNPQPVVEASCPSYWRDSDWMPTLQHGHPWSDWSNAREKMGKRCGEYRDTGVSSPMLLPITEAWCIEYTLLFDPQKVLRDWLRKDCGQSLDLNSASLLEHLGRIIEMGARMARGTTHSPRRVKCFRLLRTGPVGVAKRR